MSPSSESAFDRDLRERMQDAEFRQSFVREAQKISTIDRIINELDEAREQLGMSKAELARAIGTNPSAIRRLLTTESANPRLETVAAIAHAVGLEVELRPRMTPDESTEYPAVANTG